MQAVNRYLFLIAALLALHGWTAAQHFRPWTAFYNEWPFFAALGLLVVPAWAAPRAAPRLPWMLLAPLALASVPLAQYLGGRIFFLGDAVMPALYLSALALACCVGYRLDTAWGGRFVAALAATILAGALLSLILAGQQWLGVDLFGIWLSDKLPDGRSSANLAQSNNLATLLCLGLAALLYLRERGQLGRALLWPAVLLLLAGVAMTRSRTALVTTAAMLAWLLVWRRRLGLRTGAAEAAVGLAVFIGLWFVWPAISALLEVQAASRAVVGGGPEYRLVIWRELLDAAFRRPWLGWGWNQVSVAQVAVAAEYPQTVLVEHAHSIVLDLLLWNGVVLGGLVVALLAAWLISRSLRLSSLEAWFGLLALIVVGTHGMLELPLEYAYFLLPLGLCVGVAERRHPRAARTVAAPAWAVGACALLLGLLAFAVAADYRTIEEDFRQARMEAAQIAPRPATPTAPDVWLLTAQREFIRFVRTEARAGMSDDELRWMGQVAQRFAFPPVLFRHALALGLNGRTDEARLELKRLRQLHPPERWDEAVEAIRASALKYPQMLELLPPDSAR